MDVSLQVPLQTKTDPIEENNIKFIHSIKRSELFLYKKLLIIYHSCLLRRPLIDPTNDFIMPDQTVLLVQNPT